MEELEVGRQGVAKRLGGLPHLRERLHLDGFEVEVAELAPEGAADLLGGVAEVVGVEAAGRVRHEVSYPRQHPAVDRMLDGLGNSKFAAIRILAENSIKGHVHQLGGVSRSC